MKILLFILTLGIFQSVVFEEAEARRRGGSAQELHFVTETKIIKNGTPLALCHLTETRNILAFINLWRSSLGYALAENKCDTKQYFSLSKEKLLEAQASGSVPNEIDAEPQMSLGMLFGGFWGIGLIGLIVVAALIKFLSSKKKQHARHSSMGDMQQFPKMLLDVMCHAAVSDGHVDASEVATIKQAAVDIAGKEFSEAEIRELIASCEKSPSAAQFKSFGKGLDPQQKALLIKGAMMVISADSDLDKSEKKFISQLASGLGISQDQFNAIIAS